MKVQSGLTLSKEDLTFYKAYNVLKAKVSIFFNACIYTNILTLFPSHLSFSIICTKRFPAARESLTWCRSWTNLLEKTTLLSVM